MANGEPTRRRALKKSALLALIAMLGGLAIINPAMAEEPPGAASPSTQASESASAEASPSASLEPKPAETTQSPTSTSPAAAEDTSRAASSKAGAALQKAGGSTVLTDSNGNTFTFSLSTMSDGTGQGTSEQCFITGANGYTPGDNSPTDGYACKNDTITYRVDWNANLTTAASVNFVFSNAETASPYSGFFTGGSAGSAAWNWAGGITGGTELGFTGSGNLHRGTMNFTKTGNLSGYWTVTYGLVGGNPAEANTGVIDLKATATMGSSSGAATTDRPVQVLLATRFDLAQFNTDPTPPLLPWAARSTAASMFSLTQRRVVSISATAM